MIVYGLVSRRALPSDVRVDESAGVVVVDSADSHSALHRFLANAASQGILRG